MFWSDTTPKWNSTGTFPVAYFRGQYSLPGIHIRYSPSMMEAKPAASFKNEFDDSNVSANVERHFLNCATLRSDSNKNRTYKTYENRQT
jgi:hypothetical protein